MKEKMQNLIEKFKKFCEWIWSECKDWHTLVLFIIVVVIMYTPVWGGYLIHLIFKKPWGSVMATAYLAFLGRSVHSLFSAVHCNHPRHKKAV